MLTDIFLLWLKCEALIHCISGDFTLVSDTILKQTFRSVAEDTMTNILLSDGTVAKLTDLSAEIFWANAWNPFKCHFERGEGIDYAELSERTVGMTQQDIFEVV